MHADQLTVAALAPGKQGQHHGLEQGGAAQQAEQQGQQQTRVILYGTQHWQPAHQLLHEGVVHNALRGGQNNPQQGDCTSQSEFRQRHDDGQGHDDPEASLQRWRQGVIDTLKGLYELGFQHVALFYR